MSTWPRLRASSSLLLGLGLVGCNLFERPDDPVTQPDPISAPRGGVGAPVFPTGASPVRLEPGRAATKTPPPITGGTLALTPDESFVVASDPDRDLVHIVDVTSHTVRSLELPAGSEPSRTIVDGDGVAHVVLRGRGELARVDIAEASLLGSVAVCAEPRGVHHDAAAGSLTVACASGRLVSLRASDYSVTGRSELDADLRDVLAGPGGSLLVSRYRSAELLRVSSGKLAQRTRALGALRSPVFNENGESHTAEAEAAVAWRTVALADGSVWMLHQESQTSTVDEVSGGYGNGCEGVTTGAVTQFDAHGTPQSLLPVSLSGVTVDLAVSADRRWVAVAAPGAYLIGGSTVNVYSAAFATSAPGAAVPPLTGLCALNSGGMLNTDAQATSLAFGASGQLYVFSREPASLSVYTLEAQGELGFGAKLALRERLSLSDVSVRDTGHDVFHVGVGPSGLSCASCHGEATDDGHVWDFSESGQRRTQHLRGGVLQRAPFHWSGDLASLQQLMDTVMTGRMSGFAVTPEYTAALGKWLDAQPAERSDPPEAAAVARGKALYESEDVGCASCHGGEDLSNQQSADVGTGGTFQVPSLKGLATRPPYMHDGCAQTLRDRFDAPCGGDAHGHTEQLSEAELDDLIAYLASL